jgi:alpha-glucosidase/alpha-D-xyloside xylohydrolase
MRALWLYYGDDPDAAVRGDEYLWGRDILVAPVTEKSAVMRELYLPRGSWYDFWTNERVEGGRSMTRPVDLATIPLFVRAGAIVPMGPLKQYTTEKVDRPLTLTIYPGADGHFILYDDDGVSFNYQKGQYTRVELRWDDRARRLTIAPEHISGTWNEITRNLEIRLATSGAAKRMRFSNKIQSVQF